MKEVDSIVRFQADIDLMISAERQLRFDRPELADILKQAQAMHVLAPDYGAALGKFSGDLAPIPLVKELTFASRAIATFQVTPEFRAFQANGERMSEVAASIGMEFARC